MIYASRYCLVICLVILSWNAHSQDDSSRLEVPKLKHLLHSKDSVGTKQDSLTNRGLQKVDSIGRTINSSLQNMLQNKSITFPGDSIKTMNQYNRASSYSDSVLQKMDSRLGMIRDNMDKKPSFIDSLNMKMKHPVFGETFDFKIDGVNVDDRLLNQPVKIPKEKNLINLDERKELKMPVIGEPTLPTTKLSELEELPLKELPKVDVSDKIKSTTSDLKEISDKGDSYKKDIDNIKEGNWEKVEEVTKDAEKLALKKANLESLESEAAKLKAPQNVLQKYQKAVAELHQKKLLDQGEDLAKKQLKDHFTGNEEKLKTGVAKLDKLKKRYGDIADSRYLPKRPPNLLKGKPVIERLIPGVDIQVFDFINLVNIDISPSVGYYIFPRWRAGVGGSYRFRFDHKINFISSNPTYGLRAFTDFNAWSGFHLRAQAELINSCPFDPSVQTYDGAKREWIPGIYAGILKRYKVSKSIYGNFQVLYNFCYEGNGLYPNKIAMRFGFEFPMKKKKIVP